MLIGATMHHSMKSSRTELTELDVSYFGFIERGENVPTLTIGLNIAEAFSVDVG